MKAIVIIERGKDGTYDAYLENAENLSFGLLGQGKTVQETIDDFMNSRDEMKSYFDEESKPFPTDLEFVFKYDVPSFSILLFKNFIIGRITTFDWCKSRTIKPLFNRA